MNLSDAMSKLADCFRAISSRRYFVKRGAILWASFPFTEHPFAVSIQVDEVKFLFPTGMIPAAISIEVATRIEETQESIPELDDDTIQALIDDTREALSAWLNARDTGGNPFVLKLKTKEASAIEFHDPSILVQGIVVTLNIDV